MGSPICQPEDIERDFHKSKMREFESNWATGGKWKNIAKRFDYNYDSVRRNIKTFVQDKLELPYHEHMTLSKEQWQALEKWADKFNNRLTGEFSSAGWFVGEGIAQRDPTGWKFFTTFNDILGYQRNADAKNIKVMNEVTTHLRDAFNKSGLYYKTVGIKFLNDLRKIQQNIYKTASEADKIKYMQELTKLVNSEDGKIMRDFQALAKLTNEDFKNAYSFKRYKEVDSTSPDKYINVPLSTLKAVSKAREYLSNNGRVFVDGLKGLIPLMELKWKSGNLSLNSREYVNFKNRVTDVIESLENSIKRGGYLPRKSFETVISIRSMMEKALDHKYNSELKDNTSVLTQSLLGINLGMLPDHVRGKNELLRNVNNEDPIFMMEQYSREALQFNKHVKSTKAYLEALQDIPNLSTPWLKGMARWIHEQHHVMNRGTSDRAPWVNNTVKRINALMTVSTMGLNIGGAVKNISGAAYYMFNMGRTKMLATRDLLSTDPKVKEALQKVSEEQGYLYPDVAKDLVTEGLIKSKNDANLKEWDYDPMSGKITYKGGDAKEFLDKWFIKKPIEGMLVFHRMGENFIRKNMFDYSFASKYNELITNPSYFKEVVAEVNGKKQKSYVPDETTARNFAKNFALNEVNLYAYEYAAHSKSRALRGGEVKFDEIGNKVIIGNNKLIGDLKGGASEVAFSLLHYPMSLVQTHHRMAERTGVEMSIKGLSPDAQMFWARYAKVFGLVALTEAAFNTNLGGIIDFDLANRLKSLTVDLYDSVLKDDEESKKAFFGIISNFTGPAVNKTVFGMQVLGVLDMPESTIGKVLWGDVDYEDPKTEYLKNYQYFGTFGGGTVNKFWPVIRDGRGVDDLAVSMFKTYPTKWTNEWNDRIWGWAREPKVKNLTPETRMRNIALRAAGFDPEKVPSTENRRKGISKFDAEKALASLEAIRDLQ